MLSVQDVSKTYNGQVALAPTTLTLAPGKTTVLIGPSGCGKSTLLRLMVGLITPDTGQIVIGGTPLTPQNAESQRHAIGYVIQDGGLFPHLTAAQNVSLLARYLGKPSVAIQPRMSELAQMVQLPEESLSRYPSSLSGGQRQRVGLMRALMLDPPLLLLDEPLGALDPITRSELQTQLKDIFATLNKTVVLVTHDMGEAAYFGDTIILMRSGKIVQSGTLDDLLHRPAERYVTDFIRAQRSPLPEVPEVNGPEVEAR
jgi:osmoprotectant transport system ATP-binding protein